MPRLIILPLLLVAVGCFWPAFSIADQSTDVLDQLINDGTSGDPPPMTAQSRDGKTLLVRDIDDTANPYAGQYADWDLWLLDNYQHDFDPSIYGGG